MRRAVVFAAFAAMGACNEILGTPDPVARVEDFKDGEIGYPPDAAPDAPAAETSAPDADAGACCPGAGCGHDLSREATNCGACAHDCLGGECRAGACTPALVAGSPTEDRGLKRLVGLAALRDLLYVTNSNPANAFFSVPKTALSGTMTTILPDSSDAGITAATVLASGGSSFFVSTLAGPRSGTIYEVSFDGGAPASQIPSFASTIAADQAYVYYTDLTGYVYIYDRAAQSVVNQFSTLPTDYASPLATDGDLVFYRFQAAINALRASDVAHPTEVFSASGVSATSFTIDPPSIYVFDATAGRAYTLRYDRTDSTHEITPTAGLPVLTEPPTLPPPVMADDTHLYIGYPRAIVRLARQGGSPKAETMVSLDDDLGAMAQDERAIYFTTYGSPGGPYAAVYRLAK